METKKTGREGNAHGLGIGIDFPFVGRIDMSLMGGISGPEGAGSRIWTDR